MRILAVQSDVPFSNETGKSIRDAAILGALRELGALTLFALRDSGRDRAPDWLDIYPIPASTRSIWKRSNPLRPLSYVFSDAEKRQLSEAIATLKPDFAVVEGVMLRDALPILQASGVPTILDMHNIESELLAAHLTNRRDRFWPGNFLQEVLRKPAARREDKLAAKSAGLVWTCSQADALKISGAPKVVPNPVPDQRVMDLPILSERYLSGSTVFIGHLGYFPNQVALATLCRKIAPNLPEGATLHVAGRSVSARQKKMMANASVEFQGSPDDLLPILAEAGYTIMPLTVGGGTRIKAIEALAAGVVIIATGKAVEGMGLENRFHYLNAETPSEALSCLNECLENPELPVSLAENGRAFAEANFGQEAIESAVADAVNSFINP